MSPAAVSPAGNGSTDPDRRAFSGARLFGATRECLRTHATRRAHHFIVGVFGYANDIAPAGPHLPPAACNGLSDYPTCARVRSGRAPVDVRRARRPLQPSG